MDAQTEGKVLANIELKLHGTPSDLVKAYIKSIKKGIEIPASRAGASAGSGKWDFLLDVLTKGDSLDMEKKEGDSFTNRARNLGFVIVTRKLDPVPVKDSVTGEQMMKDGLPEFEPEKIRVWFEGFPNKKSKEFPAS